MDAHGTPHALVVGGTGMLAGVVRGLAAAGHRTAVVARGAGAHHPGPGRVVPVAADYTVPGAIRNAFRAAAGDGASVKAAVLWVRSPHRQRVYEAVAGQLRDGAVVVDVLGSAVADPSSTAGEGMPAAPDAGAPRTYRRVVLGFADGPSGTQWLTHEEISRGVLAVVAAAVAEAAQGPGPDASPSLGSVLGSGLAPVVVGRVRPWGDRPR